MQDITIYDHSNYGEAYDAMARHVSDMSGLDRIIFEDCNLSAGRVVAPHMNMKAYPHWLCPEYIVRKIGCELQEAADLLDCWVMLDPTQEMIETFLSWVKARGVEKALAYFEKLAMALAEVENIDPDDVTEDPEPGYEAPDPYRYHVVGEYPEDDQKAWLHNQPRWFKNLIAKSFKHIRLFQLDPIRKPLTLDITSCETQCIPRNIYRQQRTVIQKPGQTQTDSTASGTNF